MKTILAVGYYHHGQTIILTSGENMNTNIQETKTQYREIAIAELPDCYAKEVFSTYVTDPNKATVIVVAKAGMISDWAAYIGWPDKSHIKDGFQSSMDVEYYTSTLRTPSQVQSYGDKLSKETADEIFPEWSYRRYRE